MESRELVSQEEQEQFAGEEAIGDVDDFSIEGDIDILKEGSDDVVEDKGKPSKKSKEPDPEEEDEDDEESETSEGDDSEDEEDEPESEDDTDDEKEQEDEPEEDEEEDEGTKLVSVQDIKKDYPDFFKKHPEMKGVIFREREYSELFTDPKEAKIAANQANTFITMERDLLGGESRKLLAGLKKNGDSLEKFVSNFLPALQEVDEATYHKIALVPIKRALRAAIKKGTNSNNANLRNSALHVHEFIFGDINTDEPVEFETKAVAQKKTPEQDKYEKKLQEVEQRDFINFRTGVNESYLNRVNKIFAEDLDPNEELSDWTKDQMSKDLVARLNDVMGKDVRFQRQMQQLWATAKSKGYDAESKSRITNTALARAKQLIPDIRRKLRAEALGKKLRKVNGSETNKPKRKVIEGPTGKSFGGPRIDKTKAKDVRAMSELDIIRSS